MSKSRKIEVRWIIFYKDNGEEDFRCQIPPHVTLKEAKDFVERLGKELAEESRWIN